jgi:hypothetical protein
MSPEVAQLAAIIDQAYNKTSWHGTNLRGSLRRVTPAQAAWRPARDRHNIWEIAVHAAYWKYAAARRFTGGSRGSFPLKGSNWFPRPAAPRASLDTAWRADLDLLDDMHDALRGGRAALGARPFPHPARKESQQLRTPLGRCRPRSLPRRTDTGLEAPVPPLAVN